MLFVSHDKENFCRCRLAGGEVSKWNHPAGPCQIPKRYESFGRLCALQGPQVRRLYDSTALTQPFSLPPFAWIAFMPPLACVADTESAVSDTARGSKTCQGRPGAYAHELVDAKTYCDWGLDYLKNVRATEYMLTKSRL